MVLAPPLQLQVESIVATMMRQKVAKNSQELQMEKRKNLQVILKKVSKKMIKKPALKQLEKELALKTLTLKK